MHKNKRNIGEQNIPDSNPDTELVPMLDEDYERSLINILPEGTAKWFRKVPEEWLSLEEQELKKVCYPEQCGGEKEKSGRSSYHTDQQLRMAFWSEYDSAQNNQRKFIPRHVYMNVVHRSTWYNQVLPDPKRLAWIMCPPGSYVAKTTEVFHAGLDLMMEYIRLGVNIDDKGNIDSKLAMVQEKIFRGAEVRTRGAIPMHVMQKTMSYNVNKNVDDTKQSPTTHGTKIEDLEAELQQLRQQVASQEQQQIAATSSADSSESDIIDVTPQKEPVKEAIDAE
jgi:hypothetical protein